MQFFQTSNNFFGRQLTTALPLIQIRMQQDVVHGQNPSRCAQPIDHRQTMDLLFRHGPQRFVNLIFGPASVGPFCADFSYAELSRESVSRSHGDANIPVSDDALDSPTSSDDRQHSAVMFPHQLNGSPNIGIGPAADRRVGHNILDFHTSFSSARKIHAFLH
jgi:hypothetical protein